MEPVEFDQLMDRLERSWHEAARSAKAARAELSERGADLSAAAVMAVRDRLDEAERMKREFMSQIEELENSLLA